MISRKYLIIGNGIAGLSAVKEIRKKDKDSPITLVTNESSHTYYRMQLTKYLSKEFKDDELLVNKPEWYIENNIEVVLSKIVEEIDIKNEKIRLDDGQEIAYEKLLIATGSRPFIPPITGKFKEGVFALRTLWDLRYIQNYLKDCQDVSVIGGGLLGLEAAWALRELGKKVNIIEFAPYLLARQLDEEISAKLQEELSKLGFTIYLDSQVEEILGLGKANGVRLNKNREIKTDAILVSSGIRPNLDLLRETEIEHDKGIKVDNHLRTNIKNIYAAGDVIEKDGMVLGLWTGANEQGRVAGANMTGEELEYKYSRLFTTLQIGDIKLFSAGVINDYDKIYEQKDEGDGIHHKIFTKEGKIVGGILFGDLKEMNKMKKAVMSKINFEEYIKEGSNFI